MGPENTGNDSDGLDVTIVRDGTGVVLDVKLYNRGGRSAVVKRMRLHVLRAVRLRQLWEDCVFIASSGAYGVELPVPEQVSTRPVTTDLSYVIAPDEAERFLVRLHADVPMFARFVYLLGLEMIYDADDRRATSRPFAVSCPKPINVWTPAQFEFMVDNKDPHVVEIVLGELEREYLELVGILASAEIMPDHLHTALAQAREVPQQLSVLRSRLGASATGASQ